MDPIKIKENVSYISARERVLIASMNADLKSAALYKL